MGDERVVADIVGRDAELALAARRWAGAAGGDGHLLLVSGEAGIGKTRLLREISTRIGAGARRVTTTVFPRDSEAAGAVVIDLAAQLRRDGAPGISASLLERLLSADDSDRSAGDSARARRLLVGDLADILVRFLGEERTLLMIEDLHWADDLSLDVLDRVAMSLGTTSSLVIATFRSDELYPRVPLRRWRARLLEQRLAEEVRLPRLDREATGEVIAALVSALTADAPSTSFVAELYDRSDGIPLHIEELVAAGSASGVPDSVADAVLSRFSELSDDAQLVAQAGAAIGRSFDIDLLVEAIDRAIGMDVALEELARAQLIVVPDDHTSLDFRHALIRDAIYDAIPPVRRRALHARIAQAGIGVRPDSWLSDQFERASMPAEAYRFATDAAAEAVRISAHREAVELFRRAQRTAPRAIQSDERAAIHVALAGELSAADDNSGSALHFASAIDLYRADGNLLRAAALVAPLVAAQHLLGVPLAERVSAIESAMESIDAIAGDEGRRVRAALTASLAAAYMLDRQLDAAIESGGRAIDLASEADNPAVVIDAQLSLGSAMVFAGPNPEGWMLLEAAVEVATGARLEAQGARAYRMIGSCASALVAYPIADRWIAEGLEYTAMTERWNDHHYLTSHRAQVEWARGHLDSAAESARRALADGRGGLTTELTARHVLGWVDLSRDRLDAARETLDGAMALASAMDELQRVGPIRWGLAEAALNAGDAETAFDHCEAGRLQSARTDDAAYLFPFLVTGTRALIAMRDVARARKWSEVVCATIARRALPGTLPSLDHARGLVALAEGNTGAARLMLERAHAGWSSLDRFWEGSFALLDLARCAHRSRRPVEAAERAGAAVAIARMTGAAILERLADELAVPASSGPLSDRELEVARLVAAGATNAEIAASLTISPSTVASHVEHILAKLGVGRRAEIAAWVARSSSEE